MSINNNNYISFPPSSSLHTALLTDALKTLQLRSFSLGVLNFDTGSCFIARSPSLPLSLPRHSIELIPLSPNRIPIPLCLCSRSLSMERGLISETPESVEFDLLLVHTFTLPASLQIGSSLLLLELLASIWEEEDEEGGQSGSSCSREEGRGGGGGLKPKRSSSSFSHCICSSLLERARLIPFLPTWPPPNTLPFIFFSSSSSSSSLKFSGDAGRGMRQHSGGIQTHICGFSAPPSSQAPSLPPPLLPSPSSFSSSLFSSLMAV